MCISWALLPSRKSCSPPTAVAAVFFKAVSNIDLNALSCFSTLCKFSATIEDVSRSELSTLAGMRLGRTTSEKKIDVTIRRCTYWNGTSTISLMLLVEIRASRLIEDPGHQSGNFSTTKCINYRWLLVRGAELTEGESFNNDCPLWSQPGNAKLHWMCEESNQRIILSTGLVTIYSWYHNRGRESMKRLIIVRYLRNTLADVAKWES